MFELIPKTHFFTVTWKIMGVKRGLYSDCPRKHHPLAWYCLTSHFKKQKIKYGFVNSYWFVVIYMIVWDVCKHCPPLALHSLQSFLVWNTLSTLSLLSPYVCNRFAALCAFCCSTSMEGDQPFFTGPPCLQWEHFLKQIIFLQTVKCWLQTLYCTFFNFL